MRTGQYKTINADYVYEGELRKVNKLSGEIAFDGDKVSDKVVGYFCYFELLNGFSKTLYMSVENMAEYAKRYSPSIKNNKELTVEKLIEKAQSGVTSTTVGWEGNFNDMALKTVIRRLLSKYGYLSVEMVNAISKDEEADNAAAVRNGENDEDLTTVDVEGVDVTTGEVLDHSAPSAIPSGTMPAGPAY
jgi:recombination protein RecT